MRDGLWTKGLVLGIILLFVGASVVPCVGGRINEGNDSTVVHNDALGSLGIINRDVIWSWAKSAGGTGEDFGRDVAVDSSGNIYITGSFRYTATFGSTTLTSQGYLDVFVAKLNSAGVWQWAKSAGGTTWDEGLDITVDSSGNPYITGYFEGTATFGSITLTSLGYDDVFVAKLNTNGAWQWAVNAGGTSSTAEGWGVAVDSSGNAYITGYFFDTATFGSDTLYSSGYSDVFVAKLSTSGVWQWVKRAGGTNFDKGWDVAVDSSGNPYITGEFQGSATFGISITLTSQGDYDVFVAKLNTNGAWQWAKSAGGTNVDNGWGIAVDASGNPYITGYFEGTATFGSDTLTSQGSDDVFVAKLSTSGVWQWAKSAGGTNVDWGLGIAVDSIGYPYITGGFHTAATFGSHTLTSQGDYDVFVAKLSKLTGLWLWAKSAGGIGHDMGLSIAVDSSGNIYISGIFEGTATFDNIILTSQGNIDVFVAKPGFNNPPNTPSTPSGPTSGVTGISYTYTTSTTDPDGDNVYYWFDWDDGTNSGWVGPYNSGSTGSSSHSWSSPGTYLVKAKAKDTYGAESGYSPNLTVTITSSSQPFITLIPTSHDFGNVMVGASSSEYSFTLQNTGTGTATGTVYLTGNNPDQFIITEGSGSFSLTAGQTKTIKVKFQPTSTGSKSATLLADGSNCNDASASLTGTGVANPPPTVTITNPPKYRIFAKQQTSTVTITGTASDPAKSITKVQVKIDNGNWNNATGTTSWSYNWVITGVTDGAHTIYVKSIDNIGQESTVVSVVTYINEMIFQRPFYKINSFVDRQYGDTSQCDSYVTNISSQCFIHAKAFARSEWWGVSTINLVREIQMMPPGFNNQSITQGDGFTVDKNGTYNITFTLQSSGNFEGWASSIFGISGAGGSVLTIGLIADTTNNPYGSFQTTGQQTRENKIHQDWLDFVLFLVTLMTAGGGDWLQWVNYFAETIKTFNFVSYENWNNQNPTQFNVVLTKGRTYFPIFVISKVTAGTLAAGILASSGYTSIEDVDITSARVRYISNNILTNSSVFPVNPIIEPPKGVITVDNEGDGNYKHIQEAINHANPGDTINVYSGTYYESVSLNKRLTIIGIPHELGSGTDTGSPVINASYYICGKGNLDALSISSNLCTVSGFNITGSKSAGIFLNNVQNNTISNNNISFNQIGILVNNNSQSNKFHNNKLRFNNYGLLLMKECKYNNFSNNNISGSIYGLITFNSSNNKFIENDIWVNGLSS